MAPEPYLDPGHRICCALLRAGLEPLLGLTPRWTQVGPFACFPHQLWDLDWLPTELLSLVFCFNCASGL